MLFVEERTKQIGERLAGTIGVYKLLVGSSLYTYRATNNKRKNTIGNPKDNEREIDVHG